MELGPNAPFIGAPGSRARLDTPALLIDLDALDRNIAAMAAHARAAGIALRPHAKTHKSRRHRAAPGRGGRARHLLRHAGRGRGDGRGRHPRRAHHLAAGDRAQDRAPRRAQRRGASRPQRRRRSSGESRGARRGRARARAGSSTCSSISRRGRAAPASPTRRRSDRWCARRSRPRAWPSAASSPIRAISSTSRSAPSAAPARWRKWSGSPRCWRGCSAAGIAVPIVTGGGTGTFDLDPEGKTFTELQVGSYVFMDVQYRRRAGRGAQRAAVRDLALRFDRGGERQRAGLCDDRRRPQMLRHRRARAAASRRARPPAAATNSSATSMGVWCCRPAPQSPRWARASNASRRIATRPSTCTISTTSSRATRSSRSGRSRRAASADYFAATASTSTSASSRASAEMTRSVEAGLWSPSAFARASR